MKKARAAKASGPKPSDIVAQKGLSEPNSKRPAELPSSSSHPIVDIIGSEDILVESEAPELQDPSVTIIIPAGITFEEEVRRVTDNIRALVQDENRQYYTDGSWSDVLEGGNQYMMKMYYYLFVLILILLILQLFDLTIFPYCISSDHLDGLV